MLAACRIELTLLIACFALTACSGSETHRDDRATAALSRELEPLRDARETAETQHALDEDAKRSVEAEPDDESKRDAEVEEARQRRLWPYFSRLESEVDSISTGILGIDPGGPRELGLWRVGAEPLLVARTMSNAEGRFDFGQQIVPQGGVSFQVAPLTAKREDRGKPWREAPPASRIEIGRRDPSPR